MDGVGLPDRDIVGDRPVPDGEQDVTLVGQLLGQDLVEHRLAGVVTDDANAARVLPVSLEWLQVADGEGPLEILAGLTASIGSLVAFSARRTNLR